MYHMDIDYSWQPNLTLQILYSPIQNMVVKEPHKDWTFGSEVFKFCGAHS